MQASLLIQALSTALVASALCYLLLLRPWRPRRMALQRVAGVDLLFLLALVIGWGALHYPGPFAATAAFLVTQTELPETLAEIDGRIDAIEALPATLWNDLKTRLGFEAALDPPPEVQHTRIVRETLMPAVIGVVEVTLRCVAYAGSLLALAISLVLRLALGLQRGARAKRPPKALATPTGSAATHLEKRVEALEEALRTLHTGPEQPVARVP